MAEENLVTNIVAKSDFSGLIGDLNKVSSRLTELQQQLNNTNKTLAVQAASMQKAFASTMRSTGQFSTHFVSLASDVEKFGKSLDSGKMKLGQYYRAWQEHSKTSGGLIRDLAKQQVQMQNAILQPLGKNAQGLEQFNVHIPRGLDNIKSKTAIARQELMIMNKVIQDGANQVINWGKNTQWAGRQLSVGLTLPIVAFGKAASDAFKQADQELVRLTKVYGGVAATSAQELGRVRKEVASTARELSSAYGASYTETIALAADIAATGKQGQDLIASTKETTRLAILGEVDRQSAMKATLAIQTAFKQNTQELSQSINFLNAVENQTSTSLGDLIEAIPKAGPVIQSMGGSVKDLALYLTAMREGGISASEGANALKSALASLINPTKVAKDMFAGFGIDLGGIVTKNAGNLTGTILELQGALDRLDPLKKQQAIEQLFGKFQFARMNALFQNLGKQGSQTLQVLDLMKASSQDLANIAGRELAQVTESASGKYKRAVETLKADLAGVGENFLNISTTILKTVDGIIKFFNKLPAPIKTAMGFLTALTAMTGPIIMLTGLLANFFGYIVKGAFHLKSLFKGGEGFRLLTPEILAAQKAANSMETTFYSDAKAAAVLQQAISNLAGELTILEQKANAATISVNPAITTVAGSVIAPGSARVADPNHPLIGPAYSRASAHLNPVAGMTQQERLSQTIFGMAPGPIPVNQRIGKNPQMYMSGEMPKIEGVTSVKGVSTGIVAEEAAKWHAMTAALSMQSETEIKALKAEVAATGTITAELSGAYQALLPEMTTITGMAAEESRLIVAELQAGKTTVDQARAKIIQLNATVEAMMAETTAGIAAAQGRSANITTVPLTGQPVVDPTTGKSNMKEMFHKSKTSQLVDKIARALGVRTSGGGYSIETTRPRKFAMGGSVVPGIGNSDTVPAMLTPGEFVINKEATAANLPLLEAINGGPGAGGPGYITGGQIRALIGMPEEFLSRINLISGARRTDTRSLRTVFSPGAQNYDQMSSRPGRAGAWSNPALALGRPNADEVVGHIYSNAFYRTYGQPGSGSSPRATAEQFSSLTGLSLPQSRSGYSGTYDILPNQFMTIPKAFNTKLNRGGARPSDWIASQRRPEHLLSLMELLTSQGIPERKALGIATQVLARINSSISRMPESSIISERMFGNIVTNSTRKEMMRLRAAGELNLRQNAQNPLPRGTYTPGAYWGANRNRRNRGGIIGFNSGGRVPGYKIGGMIAQQAGSIGGSIAGGMLGSSVAGPIGGIVGSVAGGFLPQLLGVLKSRELMTAAQIFTKTNIAIGGTVAALGLLYGAYKRHQESLRLTAASYGLTADAAQKAGLKYTDYNTKIKDSIANTKLLIDKNRIIAEGMTSAKTPFSLTITEFKKLQKEIKATMSDQVKLFDKSSMANVSTIAVRLKEQFMAAGMSAEDAAKKIYTMISLSNKSGMAASTIGGKSFSAINTPEKASVGAFKQFNVASQFGDAKAQAAALNTALMSVETGIASIVKTAEDKAKKDKTNFDASKAQYAAQSQMLEMINTKVKSQKRLSADLLDELKKQNPQIRAFATESDTALSIWQKLQIAASGFTGDLSKVGAAGAGALYRMTQNIKSTVEATNKGGILKGQYKALQGLQAQAEKATKAMAGQSAKQQISDRDAIKLIDKKIAAINKEADARIKAIRHVQEAESFTTDLKKKQLEYQDALASGDMSRAAQAQLDITQLSSARQATLSEEAITTARDKKLAPLEKQKTAINDKQQALADSAALASDNIGTLNKKIQDQKDKIDAVNTAMTNLIIAQQTHTGNIYDLSKTLQKAIKDAGITGTTGKTSVGEVTTKLGADAGFTKNKTKYSTSPGAISSDITGRAPYSVSPTGTVTVNTTATMPTGNIKLKPPAVKKPVAKVVNPKGSSLSPSFNIPGTNYSFPMVESRTASSPDSSYVLNFTVNGSNMKPDDLWTFMQNKIKILESKNGKGRNK